MFGYYAHGVCEFRTHHRIYGYINNRLKSVLWPLLQTWISSLIHYKVWLEITYSFPNLNGEIEV